MKKKSPSKTLGASEGTLLGCGSVFLHSVFSYKMSLKNYILSVTYKHINIEVSEII